MARYVQEEAKYTVLEAVAAAIILAENKTSEEFTAKYPNILSIVERFNDLPFDRAQEMIDTVANGFVVRVLKGAKISEFQQNLNALLQNSAEKITARKFNVLSYTPNVYETFKKEESLTDIAYNSKFVGNVRDSIQLDLKILRCTFIQSYGFYVALAQDVEGNLYAFNPKGMLNETKDFSYKVKAKIKAHVIDKYVGNAQVTRLNYVKELNEG